MIAESVSSCRELFEVVCTSFEGSLRHFTKEKGKIEPVLDPMEVSSGQLEVIRKVHAGILAYAKKYCAHELTQGFISPELAVANVLRIIEKPTFAEADKLGALEYGDGSGSLTRKPLADFTNPTLKLLRLMEMKSNAYWQQGLVAKDSVQAWLLSRL
jgi:hypothetical protein